MLNVWPLLIISLSFPQTNCTDKPSIPIITSPKASLGPGFPSSTIVVVLAVVGACVVCTGAFVVTGACVVCTGAFVVAGTVGFTVGLVVCFFATTLTLHFNFFLPTFAVTTVLPGLIPFIFPFFVTLTIFLFADFHLTFFLALFFLTFNFTVLRLIH